MALRRVGRVALGHRHQRLSLEESLAHFPALRRDCLVAGFLYWDARADDARLTLDVARTAVLDHGAAIANYAPVTALHKDDAGRLRGVRIGIGDGIDIGAACVVNAAGVWVDAIRELDEGPSAAGMLRPAKGIHIAVPRDRLEIDVAAVLPVHGDHRSIFVVPWDDHVYIGTTDTDYDGPLDDPPCTSEDVDYLLAAVNAHTSSVLTAGDVVGTWAGLRPLVASADSARTADLSRRHQVSTSASGLVTIAGGKLTTYRRMASDTVDEVGRVLGRRLRPSPTRRLRLRGAVGADTLRRPGAAGRLNVSEELLAHLVRRYGGEARTVIAMTEADPELARPLLPGLPHVRAEAVYAARYEMAQTLEDVLSRRTRALLFAGDVAAEHAQDVAHLVAPELGWSPARVEHEVASLTAAVAGGRRAAGLAP